MFLLRISKICSNVKVLLKLLLPLASAYLLSYALTYFRKHDLDPHRLFTFGFIRDMKHVAAAEGRFDWIAFTGWFLVCIPVTMVILNFISIAIYFETPIIARRLDQTIERLAKLPAHVVGVEQVSPTLLIVSTSPSAPLPLRWFQDNETQLEAGAGIDILSVQQAKSGVVKLTFSAGARRTPAQYFIEVGDGSGTLRRVDSEWQMPFVYITGNKQTLEECDYFKIGFSEDERSLANRFKESRRQMENPRMYVKKRVPGRSDETRLHEMFSEERIELEKFRPSPRLLQFIREHQTEGHGVA